ncbi:hypothetical protein [Pleomorphomonas oryzae]|uniref:hypothetical protein n=1 Tax=Pleomorphomonas oryzae TaxID=261934 RepID=UPI0003FB7026|nr:hypothetical protein [Pleomorphomonas oryzae]
MKAAVLAMAGLAALSVGARADDRIWLGLDYESGASLVYGVPESDDAPIAFVCELPARELIMDLSLGEAFQPRSGKVNVKITAPPTTDSLALGGEVQVSEEIGDVILEARGRLTPQLSNMLAKGKELIIAIGEEKRTFPLTGASEAMRPLSSACGEPK